MNANWQYNCPQCGAIIGVQRTLPGIMPRALAQCPANAFCDGRPVRTSQQPEVVHWQIVVPTSVEVPSLEPHQQVALARHGHVVLQIAPVLALV